MVTLYSIFQDFIKQTKIYIQNVLPKKVSELTNDAGYLTSHQDISGKQDKLTFDTTPTTNSSNPVTSGGIKTALDTVSKKADIQADWNSTDSSSIAFIKNIPNSIKSINNSSKFRIKSFNKEDNGGHPTYKIIEELVNYHPTNRPNNWKTYGFSIIALCDIRDGNGFSLEPAFMYASLGWEHNMLKSTSGDDFPVVLHNIESDKYYVAIRTTGFYKTISLIGDFVHPDIELGEEIFAQDNNGTPPSGWELTYKPQSMLSMEQLRAGRANDALKLTVERLIKLTGDMTGEIYFDGSKDITVNTTVNESKHAADVTDATVSPGKSKKNGDATIPAAGVIDSIKSKTGSSDLTNMKQFRSFIGSVNDGENTWYNMLSLRHRNGASDGPNYGLLMYSKLTDKNDTIHYKKQTTDWTEERTLLDSSNYNSFAPTKTGSGASGTWGINISGNAANDSNGANIASTYLKLDSFKSSLIASFPACYERSTMWSATKNVITVPDYITVNIGNNGYVKTGASTIDVNTASNWDNSTYAMSANRTGKDFYIYACQASGTVPKFVLSANSTVPTGYTATNSRKIGGFHCECADVGTINGHPLSGYIAGDILPRSIWDLKHRPVSSPEGMVWCDGVWVDIYLAGWNGSKLVSQYKAVIQDGNSTKKWHGELFNEEFHKIKKRLLWRDEFAAYAKGSNEKTNISGSADPNTTGGHKDTANRRMISNYGLEDCCGVLWQWTNNISMRGTVTNGTDSDYASSGNYWLNGYGWDSANRIGNSDIDGDKTKYGNEYGLLVRLFVGGYWCVGSACGSRSVAGKRLSARRYGANAGRGASEPWVG